MRKNNFLVVTRKGDPEGERMPNSEENDEEEERQRMNFQPRGVKFKGDQSYWQRRTQQYSKATKQHNQNIKCLNCGRNGHYVTLLN